MPTKRNRLYAVLLLVSVAGFIGLYFASQKKYFGLCIFKKITSFPCPSCGSTRSIIAILNGNFKDAFYLNPLGYFLLIVLVCTPIWIVVDFFTKRKSLFDFYQKIEFFLQKPTNYRALFLLLIINWIWNIFKNR